MSDKPDRLCVFVSARGDQWAIGAGGTSPLCKTSNAQVQHIIFCPGPSFDAEIIAKAESGDRFILVSVLTTGAYRELELTTEEVETRIKEMEASGQAQRLDGQQSSAAAE